MKKILAFILASTLALTMAACGNTPAKGGNTANSTPNSTSGSASTPKAKTTSFFGKISEITGNEIEFNLAKMPDEPASQSQPEGDTTAAVALTPATEANTADGGGAANRIEVEYTGETKSFIIPAGVEIKDPSGTVKQLTDLKKGSMLSITAQDDGTVVEVIVLE